MVPAFLAFAVIPFGTGFGLMGRHVDMMIADVDVGLLFILAMSSLGVYGIVLAGWSSGNKWSILGGMRSSAQMISYELPMGVSLVGPLILAGSLRLSDVVQAQAATFWFILPQFVAFICYIISGIAETNRAPFDLPEAEQELTAGYHTEYTSFRFAMFFMGEYVAMVAVSALAVTFFFGGYRGFFPQIVWLQPVWLLLKMLAFLYLYVWIRGTFPRVRYDQLMRVGWKALLPVGLLNLLVTAGVSSAYGPQRVAGVGMVVAKQAAWVLTGASMVGAVLMYYIGSWALARAAAYRALTGPRRRQMVQEDIASGEGRPG
jgi:NADH-quinone oxidoreductase subunit H